MSNLEKRRYDGTAVCKCLLYETCCIELFCELQRPDPSMDRCLEEAITSWQIDGEKMEIGTDFIFSGSKSLQTVTPVMKLKDTCPLEEKL